MDIKPTFAKLVLVTKKVFYDMTCDIVIKRIFCDKRNAHYEK